MLLHPLKEKKRMYIYWVNGTSPEKNELLMNTIQRNCLLFGTTTSI